MLIVEFQFTADTVAFAVGDVITLAQTKNNLFDFDGGNAKLIEYTIEQRNATACTKKAIHAVMFHDAPTSMTVAVNAADSVSALDFVKVAGTAKVVTADYVDYNTASEFITVATVTNNLPVVYNSANTATDNKKALWIKILAGETMTFGAATLVHIKLQFEIF